MNKLISIILPYYKKKKFIIKTLSSIYSQSYRNFELIIIYDDQNKDDFIFINNYIKSKRLKNVRIINNKKNIGVGLSRNLGVNKSRGKFIAFIDADDYWLKNKLKYQINLMKKNNHDFTFTGYEIIDKKDKIIGKRNVPNKISFNKLLVDNKIGLSTVVLKKKLIKGNYKFPNIKTKEDFVLWLKLSKKIDLIGLNLHLTKWRKLDDSLSSNTLQKVVDGYKVYNKFLKLNKFSSFFYLFLLSMSYFKKNIN